MFLYFLILAACNWPAARAQLLGKGLLRMHAISLTTPPCVRARCCARSHRVESFSAGAEECGMGYQYMSPPEVLNCRANITVTRLRCWIAIPSVIPAGTSVNVLWYWRTLNEAERGSNAAFEITDSPPFKYVHTICNREEFCPSDQENLTVTLSQLEISHFEAALQGDYACRVVLTNQTTAVVQHAMPPSTCARVRLVHDLTQNCEILGQHQLWSCADTIQQPDECPREFLSHRSTSVVTSTTLTISLQSTAYTASIRIFESTVFLTSTRGSPTLSPLPYSSYSRTTTYPSPTLSGTPTEQKSSQLNFINVALGVGSILILAAIGTVVLIILCIRITRRKKLINLKNGR